MLGLDLREMTAVTGAHLVQGGSRLLFRSITTDTRSLQAGDIFIALKGDRYDGHDFVNAALDKGAAGVIVARLPADLRRSVAGRIEDGRKEFFILQAQDTLRALGDIAHAHRMKFNIPMIGITGSTGKTTVKEMIARVLGRKYSVLKNEGTENNLIGVAWTLLRLNAAHEAGVIEMGTNHFGEIERLAEMAEPDTGIITNIGPSHLEFLISEDGVLREKASLLRRLLPCHRALINADDERLTALDGCAAKIVRFGIDNAADFRATKIVQRAGKLFFTVEGVGEFTLKALGRHNIYNALAAIATGVMHGIAPAQVREALAVCEPVPGRMSLLRAGGFEIIDDAYNANPLSVRAAVDALTAHPSAGKKFFI
ncbi:MAG: UDP-N-acetylmuramoyl-tripeptide--D-alanyl-D-alanine ligase, partial [Candidatus Omnitrophota bacterium]